MCDNVWVLGHLPRGDVKKETAKVEDTKKEEDNSDEEMETEEEEDPADTATREEAEIRDVRYRLESLRLYQNQFWFQR